MCVFSIAHLWKCAGKKNQRGEGRTRAWQIVLPWGMHACSFSTYFQLLAVFPISHASSDEPTLVLVLVLVLASSSVSLCSPSSVSRTRLVHVCMWTSTHQRTMKDGWMEGKWSGNSFLLSSSFLLIPWWRWLAHLLFLTTYQQLANGFLVGG